MIIEEFASAAYLKVQIVSKNLPHQIIDPEVQKLLLEDFIPLRC